MRDAPLAEPLVRARAVGQRVALHGLLQVLGHGRVQAQRLGQRKPTFVRHLALTLLTKTRASPTPLPNQGKATTATIL